MAGNSSNNNDEQILRFLDLPSSELGNQQPDFSEDDDDWDADPIYLPVSDEETISDGSVSGSIDILDDSAIAGPSNAKRKKTSAPIKSKTVKIKTFKPKIRRATKKQKSKYNHNWNKNIFLPIKHKFDDSSSGIVDPDSYSVPTFEVEFFEKMLPDETLEYIVVETNRQYEYLTSSVPLSEKSRLNQWVPLTVKELKVFIAITLLMVHNKKISIENYWSTDSLHKNTIPNFMSKNRYLLILRLLHFCDNTQPALHGRLSKIKVVVDMFRKSFSQNFQPFRNLCIDESLLLFKGNLSFKQFIPSKRSRFGIKTYLLCDCETGYVLDLIVYTGSDTEILDTEGLGLSGAIVTTLLGPYLNKGHCLFIDNWYSSPSLFTYLHLNKTNACGTVRTDRMGMPQFEDELRVGEREVMNDGTNLVVRWIDKRQVVMITNEHEDEVVRTHKVDYKTKESVIKPKCIQEYNSNMGAVDRTDMMIVNVESIRRTQRWYKKLFFHLVDLSILNSHALYLCRTGKKPTLPQFHLELVRQLLERNVETRLSNSNKGGRPSPGETPLRLTQRHFPSFVPPTEKKTAPCRQCHVCKNTSRREQKRRETRYMCVDCGLALCAAPCFADYHSLKHY